MTVTSERTGIAQPANQTGLSWRRLVVILGIIATVATVAVAVYLTDIEGGVVAIIFGVSTWLFHSGRKRTGLIGLMLVSAVTLYFMATAALTNLGGWAGAEGLLIALGLAGVASLVLIASVGWLIMRDEAASFGPWLSILTVAAAISAPIAGGVLGNDPERAPATLEIVAENVKFSDADLTAAAGEVTVSVENRDLFWHTFTIEELGVDLRVPVSAEMTVTFDAPPGEYRFICAIPGHPEAGMEGTLVVEG